MITGMISPFSIDFVLSLNSCTNLGAEIPCGPRAGPIGGAGVADPAGHCSLMTAVTFFVAIIYLLTLVWTGSSVAGSPGLTKYLCPTDLYFSQNKNVVSKQLTPLQHLILHNKQPRTTDRSRYIRITYFKLYFFLL